METTKKNFENSASGATNADPENQIEYAWTSIGFSITEPADDPTMPDVLKQHLTSSTLVYNTIKEGKVTGYSTKISDRFSDSSLHWGLAAFGFSEECFFGRDDSLIARAIEYLESVNGQIMISDDKGRVYGLINRNNSTGEPMCLYSFDADAQIMKMAKSGDCFYDVLANIDGKKIDGVGTIYLTGISDDDIE